MTLCQQRFEQTRHWKRKHPVYISSMSIKHWKTRAALGTNPLGRRRGPSIADSSKANLIIDSGESEAVCDDGWCHLWCLTKEKEQETVSPEVAPSKVTLFRLIDACTVLAAPCNDPSLRWGQLHPATQHPASMQHLRQPRLFADTCSS